jgi:hypothetical protein
VRPKSESVANTHRNTSLVGAGGDVDTGAPDTNVRETLINGPTSEVAGEMASNFLDDEANRRSIQ